MIITWSHFKNYRNKCGKGYCVKGGKRWFERYGLDWKMFLKDGLPEEQFADTGDALGINLVKYAHSLEDKE